MAVAATLASAFLAGSLAEASAQNCKPRRPRPPVTLTSMGPCEFDPDRLAFAGNPVEQAMCLMRAADHSRNIGPMLESLPPAIAGRVGQTTGLPDREALAAHLTELGLVYDYAPFLWTPLSRASDNEAEAPQARYFVIHDTSAPFFGGRPFPVDIDENHLINNLARYTCKDDWAFAHVFINRGGKMLLSRELSEPWRATKFERATRFGTDLKGLFLHIELIQPRGSMPGRRGDARAPDPGFSAIQYERLALVYVIASVRSGRWLIPGFHAAIDSGIRSGHDDPQNFAIESFAASIDNLVARLSGAPVVVASVTHENRAADTPSVAAAGSLGSASAARATIARSVDPEPEITPALGAVEPAAETAGARLPAVDEATASVPRTSARQAVTAPKRIVRVHRPVRKAYRYVRAKPKVRRSARLYR